MENRAIALGAGFSYAALFVGSLYAIPRRVRSLHRDHPTHIVYRMLATSIVACIAPAICVVTLADIGEKVSSKRSSAETLGVALHCQALSAFALPWLAIVALFTGPLVEMALLWRASGEAPPAALEFAATAPLEAVRNWLVGPLLEEWVFRVCTLPMYLSAGFSPTAAIVLSGLTFGCAHAHHFIEMRRNGRSWGAVLQGIALMLTYTTAFGAIAGYLWYMSGSFWAIFSIHVFCNVMGLPTLPFLSQAHPLYPRRLLLLAIYVVGIVLFFWTLLFTDVGAQAPCSWYNVTATAS